MAISALVLKNSVCGPGCGRRTICGSSGEAEVSFEIVASVVGLVSVGGGISSSHVVTGNFVTRREVDDGGWMLRRFGSGCPIRGVTICRLASDSQERIAAVVRNQDHALLDNHATLHGRRYVLREKHPCIKLQRWNRRMQFDLDHAVGSLANRLDRISVILMPLVRGYDGHAVRVDGRDATNIGVDEARVFFEDTFA